jgi:hypothetical protein
MNSPYSRVLTLALISCALLCTSCSSIINGRSQQVTVTSDPSGASFTVNGEQELKTPAVFKLKRKNDHIIVFDNPGYQQERTVLKHMVSGWVAGNIFLGGPIGLGVDAMTGGMYQIVPDALHMRLHPVAPNTLQSSIKKIEEPAAEEVLSEET